MRLRLLYFSVGIVALAAVLLCSRSNQSVLTEYEHIDSLLDILTTLDVKLRSDVLKARSRLLPNYDTLAENVQSEDATIKKLESLMASVPEYERSEFRKKVQNLSELLSTKAGLIEQFKSDSAVLNNSLEYFPAASAEILTGLRAGTNDHELEECINGLLQQILVYTLLPEPGDAEDAAIRASISKMGEWRAAHPGHPQLAPVALVTSHVAAILRRKPKVETATERIVSLPTALAIEELTKYQKSHLTATMRKSDILKVALEAVCGALVLAIGYTVYALHVANRSLERRVIKRTEALQEEAAEHRRTAHERDRFFAASVDLQAIIRVNGFCQRVNPAVQNVLGWTPGEWLAEPLIEFLHPDDRPALLKALDHAMHGESVDNVEVRCRCKDGTLRWIAWSSAAADADGQLFVSGRDVSERKSAERELDEMHKQLLETSRQAGMAEVATGVLHNVGNVLNSVNVSTTLLAQSVRKSRIANIGRVVGLLEENAENLAAFMTESTQGKNLPGYLRQLHDRLLQEQREILSEAASLQQNVDHIKDIVTMQQDYAKVSGVAELLTVEDLVEDALRMNEAALERHGVTVERDFADLPRISVEKHKVLQILVNLIRNAKYACDEGGRTDKRLTMRVRGAGEIIRISVVDNGVGISAENMTRIFNHGFTTRKDGHGFGLHSGALAASELGGSLRAESEGPGCGAMFTLELPTSPRLCGSPGRRKRVG